MPETVFEMRKLSGPRSGVDIIVIDGVSLITMALIVRPLRCAASISRQEIPVRTFGWPNKIVSSSDGIHLTLDDHFDDSCYFANNIKPHAVIICGGWQGNYPPALLDFVRSIYNNNIQIYSVGPATWLLAEAGLDDLTDCAVHWAEAGRFLRDFPSIRVTEQIASFGRGLFNSPGELATLELCMRIVEDLFDTATCEAVLGKLLVDRIRKPHFRQIPVGPRDTSVDPFVQALSLMESNIENPQPLERIFEQCGLSRRQCERLFKEKIALPPHQAYLEIRLKRAKSLLEETDLPIQDVQAACGFKTTATFNRLFMRAFSNRPSDIRRRLDIDDAA